MIHDLDLAGESRHLVLLSHRIVPVCAVVCPRHVHRGRGHVVVVVAVCRSRVRYCPVVSSSFRLCLTWFLSFLCSANSCCDRLTQMSFVLVYLTLSVRYRL